MSKKVQKNKFPNPFSLDERETLKKWSNLSKSKKLLSPFQRKILYEAGLFDEIFLQRFSQITEVLGEFSELLDISEEDRDTADKLWDKVIRNHYKIEVERENDEFYILYAEGFRYGVFGLKEDAKKAIYWYKKAAQKNDPQAQFNIGEIYLNGEGIQSNHIVAKEWFEKSSAQGHAESQYQLACLYLNEDLEFFDQKFGYELLKKASTPSTENDFEPSSQAIVGRGLCLQNGWGVKKNLKEAVKFYKKASDPKLPGGDNPLGMYYLGLAHYNGTGVPRNFELAFKFFLMAADQELSNAEYFVAGLLYYGEGVQQNYSKAIRYFKKVIKDQEADEKYIIESFFKLGFCYLYGEGIKQNTQIALRYLNKAAEAEHIEAKYWLGCHYFDLWNELEEDTKGIGKKAYKFLKSASDQNIELSLHFLGQCYETGIGVKQNFDKALINYKKSVLQNNDANSVICIADIYYFKKEVDNIPEALKWYKKAEKMGIIEGTFRVAEIELFNEETNKKELIKKLKTVVKHKYDEGELDWSKEAQEYIDDLKSDQLENKDFKKIEKKGNVLYPSVFQNIHNNIDKYKDSFEEEIDNENSKPKSHLTLVKKSKSKIEKEPTLDELLEKGETAHIEFKQTMHYDVNGNASGAPESAIIKTVIAFFNGQKKAFESREFSGEIIVGVKDNGEVVGLENDFKSIPIIKKVETKREKEDKSQIWIRELLRKNLRGYEDLITEIKIEFENYKDKDVIRIKVPKSKIPVYPTPIQKLKEYIISQAFYIKDGNSIRVLEGAPADRYKEENFNINNK